MVSPEQITLSQIEANCDLRVTQQELLSNDYEFGVGTNASLSIFSVQNPIGGSVTIDGNGDIIYANAGHQGQPTFEYTVIDGNGGKTLGCHPELAPDLTDDVELHRGDRSSHIHRSRLSLIE